MSKLRIKEILRTKHLSAARLGKMLGISPQSITPIVSGRQSPSLKTLDRIANCLDVPIAELFETPTEHAVRCPYCGNPLKIDKDEIDISEKQQD